MPALDVEPAQPILRTVSDLRRQIGRWRRDGARVGLAPISRAPQAVQAALVETARQGADKVILAVAVNPAQAEDAAALDRQPTSVPDGCDLIYAPTVTQMYPEGFSTIVTVMELSEPLCGAAQPGRFEGAATVMLKLLNQALPDVAVFGEKKWQELLVVRRMVRDLNLPVRVLSAPIQRETDGLAISAANRRLTPKQRALAPRLHRVMREAARMIRDGASPEVVCAASAHMLAEAGFDGVEYFELRDAETLTLQTTWRTEAPARLFAAAALGEARLIDNLAL